MVARVPDDSLTRKAETATKESAQVEFKETFDPTSARDRCELVKDVVAMANSGGGCILFGVKDDGSHAGTDLTLVRAYDLADLTNQLLKFTGLEIFTIEMQALRRGGQEVWVWVVEGVDCPVPFSIAGTYTQPSGDRGSAFAQGTVYFRHGAKSSPARAEDLQKVLRRELARERRRLLGGVRKVVSAPKGHAILVAPPGAVLSTVPSAPPVRLTSESSAPLVRGLDPDVTHPHRRKEFVAEVNRRLPDGARISLNDVNDMRRVLALDPRREFVYKSRFSSPRYSNEFVSWVVAEITRDPSFIATIRARARTAPSIPPATGTQSQGPDPG